MSWITFTRGRLCIGLDRRDHRKVWFKPVVSDRGIVEDDDGTIHLEYTRLVTLGPTPREPMAGEIMWLPHFDPRYFEIDGRKEKEKRQRQFLGDAWKYLAETEPEKIQELEEKFAQPYYRDYRKWQTWYDEAKIFKQKKLRGRNSRIARRTTTAREHAVATGIPVEEIDVNSDTSAAEDSGFECERLPVRERAKRKRRHSNDMPPPPRPATPKIRRKRKANGEDSRPSRLQKKKKDKFGVESLKQHSLYASGGLTSNPFTGYSHLMNDNDREEENVAETEPFPPLLPSSRPSWKNVANTTNPRPLQPYVETTDDDDEHDIDHDSHLYDPTPPEEPQPQPEDPHSHPPRRLSGFGFAARLHASTDGSRTGSNAGRLATTTLTPITPATQSQPQSPYVPPSREGSVMDAADYSNACLDDVEALRRARWESLAETPTSLAQEESARFKREIQASVDRDFAGG